MGTGQRRQGEGNPRKAGRKLGNPGNAGDCTDFEVMSMRVEVADEAFSTLRDLTKVGQRNKKKDFYSALGFHRLQIFVASPVI